MARLAHLRVYAMLTLVMLFWAGNSIVGRAVHAEISPFMLAFLRWAAALALLAPFAWPHVRRDWPVAKRHWREIALLGFLGVGSFNTLLYSGLAHTTATNSVLIQAGIPALVLLFGALFFRERPERAQIIGVLIAALGVFVIVARGDPSVIASLQLGLGDLLILGAVLIWALYTVLLRLRPPIHPLSFLMLTFAFGVVALAPLAAADLRHHAFELTPSVAGAIAYVAVLPSLAAYFLYNKAVEEIGAADAGQSVSLQPLLGALLAALFLREPLHPYHALGMALIAAGILLPLIARRAKR